MAAPTFVFIGYAQNRNLCVDEVNASRHPLIGIHVHAIRVHILAKRLYRSGLTSSLSS